MSSLETRVPLQAFVERRKHEPHKEPVFHREIEVTVFGQQEFPRELTDETIVEACRHSSRNRLRKIVSREYGPHHEPEAIPHTRTQLVETLLTRYHLGRDDAREIAENLRDGEVIAIVAFHHGRGFTAVVKQPELRKPKPEQIPYEILIAACKNS